MTEIETLAATETVAIRARMRAEAAECLAILRAADPTTASVNHWKSWPHYVGLVVPGVANGRIGGKLGDPFTHSFHDPNMAAILAEVGDGVHYIGNGAALASYLGRAVGILVGGSGFVAPDPLGGMVTIARFDALGLGAHWRHAARVYAAEQAAAIQVECVATIHEARERSASTGITLAIVNAFCGAAE